MSSYLLFVFLVEYLIKIFTLQDFDRILLILNNLHEIYTDEDGPAMVFNCEQGKGRTTTGMAIAALIYCNKKVNNTVSSSGVSYFAWRRARNASHWWRSAMDHEMEKEERRLGTRRFVS